MKKIVAIFLLLTIFLTGCVNQSKDSNALQSGGGEQTDTIPLITTETEMKNYRIASLYLSAPAAWKCVELDEQIALFPSPDGDSALGGVYILQQNASPSMQIDEQYDTLVANMASFNADFKILSNAPVTLSNGLPARKLVYTHTLAGEQYYTECYFIHHSNTVFVINFAQKGSMPPYFADCIPIILDSIQPIPTVDVDNIIENTANAVKYEPNQYPKEGIYYIDGIVTNVFEYTQNVYLYENSNGAYINTAYTYEGPAPVQVEYGDAVRAYGVYTDDKFKVYYFEKAELPYTLKDIENEYKAKCKSVDYQALLNAPEEYNGSFVCIQLEVVQGIGLDYYRCYAITNGTRNTKEEYIIYDARVVQTPEIIKNSVVTVYGEYYAPGIFGEETAPEITVQYFEGIS